MNDLTQNLISELRRGTLVLTVLSQLGEKQYGYSLAQLLTDKGMDIEQGTLYPLLRRLEKQGLLDSEWSVEGPRPRRYYVINDVGKETLAQLTQEWINLSDTLNHILRKESTDES